MQRLWDFITDNDFLVIYTTLHLQTDDPVEDKSFLK